MHISTCHKLRHKKTRKLDTNKTLLQYIPFLLLHPIAACPPNYQFHMNSAANNSKNNSHTCTERAKNF